MKGRLGIPAVLAVVFVILAVPFAAGGTDAAVGQSYNSQLDDNGIEVYDQLSKLAGCYSNTAQVSADFGKMVLFDSEDEAKAYGERVAHDAMAAKYYSDPMIAHLWNIPVVSVPVDVSTAEVTVTAKQQADVYFIASSVSFQLAVPEEMKDDPSTETNELAQKMDEVKSAVMKKDFDGQTQYLVRDVASYLKGIKDIDDEDGKVSNIYDALISKKSSSAGVAAAFTAICTFSGVDTITVKGNVFDNDDEPSTAYWNQVRIGDTWYAVDAVMKNSGYDGYMMAGFSSEVSDGESVSLFSATHVADLDMADENGLVAPQLSRDTFPYPDETPFLQKYGAHIMLLIIGLIIVFTLLHAVKHGNL